MPKTKSKQQLGQFMTTNYKYILQNMHIPEHINHIIEPFCGEGHLLKFINNIRDYTIEAYDIDIKNNIEYVVQMDTILNPPIYTGKFVLTNPPYLARNKSKDKTLYDKYKTNDLYKCFIKELLRNHCIGGIIIIPLNFWCSVRKADIELRSQFLENYAVSLINIFEEPVFDDTTYTICSFQFELKQNKDPNHGINITIYPDVHHICTDMNKDNNFTIGGEIYNLPNTNVYKISRLTKANKNQFNHSNILAKCIDDNQDNQIQLLYVDDVSPYIDNTPNLSARTYAILIIEPYIDQELQKTLIYEFNAYLNNHRNKYHSLFLTNYRESKDIARKRISFDLVYNIVAFILDTKYKG